MKLKKFSVDYWDSRQEESVAYECLAESFNLVLDHVNKECPPNKRESPYRGEGDTLTIVETALVETPFIIKN